MSSNVDRSRRAAEARDAHLKESMGAYSYRQSCGALWPDVWEMALALLRRVDPAEATRVEAGIPGNAPKGG